MSAISRFLDRCRQRIRWIKPLDFRLPTEPLPDYAVTWELVGGQRVAGVHHESKCAGQPCCIHNPSNHHMADWPQNFRMDRGLMERICPTHGIGHPDPDDPSPDHIHGCCGCCTPPRPGLDRHRFDVV